MPSNTDILRDLMAGLHSLNTGHILTFILLLVVAGLLVMAARTNIKEAGSHAGVIEVNRNDPTKDFVIFHLDTYPDDWKDGDKLIFTVREHIVKEEK